MKRLFIALFITFAVSLVLAHAALAHAKIDHCTPAPGTAVSTAPKEVRCWFTEEIDDKESTLAITDSNGARVDNNDGKVDLNDATHQQLAATVKTLAPGVYKVAWHVVTPDDKGVSEGTWYFGVGPVAVPTYVPPADEATPASQTPGAISAPAAATAVAQATVAATPAAPAQATVAAATPTTSTRASGTPVGPTVTAPVGTPPGETSAIPLVVVGGIVELVVVAGVLFYLYRSNP